MSIGEYTSVQSQRESERADVQREIDEHEKGPMERKAELVELANIWINRGLSPNLAFKVGRRQLNYCRTMFRNDLINIFLLIFF